MWDDLLRMAAERGKAFVDSNFKVGEAIGGWTPNATKKFLAVKGLGWRRDVPLWWDRLTPRLFVLCRMPIFGQALSINQEVRTRRKYSLFEKRKTDTMPHAPRAHAGNSDYAVAAAGVRRLSIGVESN